MPRDKPPSKKVQKSFTLTRLSRRKSRSALSNTSPPVAQEVLSTPEIVPSEPEPEQIEQTQKIIDYPKEEIEFTQSKARPEILSEVKALWKNRQSRWQKELTYNMKKEIPVFDKPSLSTLQNEKVPED